MSFLQGWIVILLLSIAVLIILLSFNPPHSDIKFARKVRDCFKDVIWDRQVFWNGSCRVEDEHGRTKFYGCDTIDEAIAKINKVLLQAGVDPMKAN